MNNVEDILNKLSKSKFRSSFKLKDKDLDYINKKGLQLIEEHCYKFIKYRLSSSIILNDGKQTPMKGHPVFIAQHSTGTCCRGCLSKWHHIPKNKPLTKEDQEYIVSVIMNWLRKNM